MSRRGKLEKGFRKSQWQRIEAVRRAARGTVTKFTCGGCGIVDPVSALRRQIVMEMRICR